jgi:hypothetical protein
MDAPITGEKVEIGGFACGLERGKNELGFGHG